MSNDLNLVRETLKSEYSKSIEDIILLPISGSNRKYFRVFFQDGTTQIATYNADINENDAFFYMQKFFSQLQLPVPQVTFISSNHQIYLQQDLGDITLYHKIKNDKSQLNTISDQTKALYFKVIDYLIEFLFSINKGFDTKKCYPIEEYNKVALRWDLDYFKYMFLKLSGINFNENYLEQDFLKIIQHFEQYSLNYFMYRDFQSRNIMIHKNQIYFIDFQSGRKGPIYYDIASLLYDAKAELDIAFRNKLLEYFINKLADRVSISDNVNNDFNFFVFVRILQALGAYGYRGLYERKEHFIQSFEPAFNNLRYVFQHSQLMQTYPYLTDLIIQQFENPLFTKKNNNNDKNFLKVVINSFSYKNGYPPDKTEHRGGFVFDCRGLPNPAKEEALKYYTGKDLPVINFMNAFPEVQKFIHETVEVLCINIDNYIKRGFTYLAVNFGCTGGQHRSVFCAETVALELKKRYDIQIEVNHLNTDNWVTSNK